MAMKRIRLLHTADIHLDSSYKALGCSARVGEQLRETQRRVFAHIVETARQWPADALLIAGDLFDGPEVSDATVDMVLEALEQLAPIQVYIAPGNRDPFTNTSPYALEIWPENVFIFKPGGWQTVLHPALPLTVHGIGCDGENASGAWFKELRIERDTRVHVAVAHGTERKLKPASGKTFAPFDAADIVQTNLTYLALGHFHGRAEMDAECGAVLRYPGAPQGRGYDDAGDRHFLQVELDFEDGGPPSVRVTPVASQEVLFAVHEMSCTIDATPESIIETLPEPEHPCVMRLRLTGAAPMPVQKFLDACREIARSRFLHFEMINELTPVPHIPSLENGNCCQAKFFQTMGERITDAPDEEAAMLELLARDLAVCACRGDDLPTPGSQEDGL